MPNTFHFFRHRSKTSLVKGVSVNQQKLKSVKNVLKQPQTITESIFGTHWPVPDRYWHPLRGSHRRLLGPIRRREGAELPPLLPSRPVWWFSENPKGKAYVWHVLSNSAPKILIFGKKRKSLHRFIFFFWVHRHGPRLCRNPSFEIQANLCDVLFHFH